MLCPVLEFPCARQQHDARGLQCRLGTGAERGVSEKHGIKAMMVQAGRGAYALQSWQYVARPRMLHYVMQEPFHSTTECLELRILAMCG